MEVVEVVIKSDGAFRATEILADLRNVAETLYFPMKLVGFWDTQAGNAHLCPQERLGKRCPHVLPPSDPAHVPYALAVQRDLGATLEVRFPHARVSVFLK